MRVFVYFERSFTNRCLHLFWINAALDVVYIAGGAVLRQQGIEKNNPQWIGWGDSIILQGGFLLVFDSVMGWRMQQSQPLSYADRFMDPLAAGSN